MLKAIPDGEGWKIGTLEELFPNASHPNADFLAENGAKEVSVFLPHDRATEELVPCAGYLIDDQVFTVKVQALSNGRLNAVAASAHLKLTKRLDDAVQNWLDSVAMSRGYRSMDALCSFATSSNPAWAAEASCGIAWRDTVWLGYFQIMADVGAGTHATPTVASLIGETSMSGEPTVGELPTITWPT